MTLILSDSEMGAGIASKLLGQLAERASVCAMVIDRTGRVVAINRGGLERLSATRDEVISQPWSTLWDGSHREAARAAQQNRQRQAASSDDEAGPHACNYVLDGGAQLRMRGAAEVAPGSSTWCTGG